MTPHRWRQINDILDAVIGLDSAGRKAFLERACGPDQDLRREIESLIRAQEESQGFIETMPMGVITSMFPQTESLLGQSFDHYQILSSLGTGGMSEVYLARDARLGRLVALKLLRPHENDSKKIDRFRQEAWAASALNHPNILTIFEVGEKDGRHFIVSEHVEGETLRRAIGRGKLEPLEAVNYVAQIAGALTAAHAAGIVHRDIKPENLMTRPDRLIKVLDFGIAKLTQRPAFFETMAFTPEDSPTEPGMIIGTVHYMSPEQVRGQEVDARSDLFSLGVVFYELLTGVRPFRGDTQSDILAALLEKTPPPLSDFTPGVPAELERIVSKLLTKNPEGRYQTASELRSALVSIARRLEMETNRESAVLQTQPFSTPAAPVSDRRPATVVYASLNGCAALIERLEPDEADEIMDQIKSESAEAVASFGGVVNRCADEEFVALFGVPMTGEDDFLRAVRAGLSVRAALQKISDQLEARFGRRPQLSIGICSGTVILRGQEGAEYSVSGDAMQIAARLAAQAQSDEILLSPETQRLVAPFFKLEEKGVLTFNPSEPPAMVYRVLGESGVRTRLEAAEVAGLTPYTGREKELAILLSLLERTAAGEGQVATILGEAGLGKSRLLHEFRVAVEQRPIALIEGLCRPQGAAAAYSPFIEALRCLFCLEPESTVEFSASSVLAGIKNISPDLEGYLHFYLGLLSIHTGQRTGSDLQGDDLKFAILDALCALFTVNAKQKTTVLLLEDWQWADEASIEVLRRLAGLASSYPLMIVVTCRPDRPPDWRSVDGQTTLQLNPLDERSSLQIMKSTLGAIDLPPGLSERLYQRTSGNPFFIEEVCRTLVERNRIVVSDGLAELTGALNDLQLPDTVQAVLRTRLNHLDADLQSTLRLASVLGREFNPPLLARMMENKESLRGRLAALERHGLIRQIRVVPDPLYRFHHALTQEVVYDSLLARQRKDLHEAAGRAIEEIYRERLEEQYELLMYHYSRSERWAKAIQYGREAAEKAERLSRFSEALAMLDQTEAWVSLLPDEEGRREILVNLQLRQERLCETLGMQDRQQLLIDRILTLAESTNDQAVISNALLRQGELETLRGSYEKAERALNEALRIKRELRDADGERLVLRSIGFFYWRTGRYEDAANANHEAIEIDRAQRDAAGYAKDLTNLASILRSQGRLEEAFAYSSEAIAIYEKLNRSVSQVYTLQVLANVHRDRGETDQAMACYQRADAIAAQNRLPLHRVILMSSMSGLYWQRGEYEKSIRLSNEQVELSRAHGVRKELARVLGTLGEHLLTLERFDLAAAPLQEAADTFGELGEKSAQARMLSSAAYVFERRAETSVALEAWEKVRRLEAGMGNISGEIEALEGMTRVARTELDRSDLALDCLRQARALAQQIGDRAKLGELGNTMAIIAWTLGDYPAALVSFEEALEAFRSLQDRVHEGLMLNSIGVTLHKLGSREEAVRRLEAALVVHGESGERLLEAQALAALGDIAWELGDAGGAQHRFESSLEIRRERNDRTGEGWMLQRLASVALSQGNRERAQKLVGEAAVTAEEIRDEKLQNACRDLGQEIDSR